MYLKHSILYLKLLSIIILAKFYVFYLINNLFKKDDYETEEFEENNTVFSYGNTNNDNNDAMNGDEDRDEDCDENYPLTREQQQQHRNIHKQLSKVNQLHKQKQQKSQGASSRNNDNGVKSKRSNLKSTSPVVSVNNHSPMGNKSGMMEQQASGYEVGKLKIILK